MNTPRSLHSFCLLALTVLAAGAFAADPTGRIPVGPETTPGDAHHSYLITQPGSYYLSESLVELSGKSGIYIKCGDVTLDLNGMAVIGDGVSNCIGVRVAFAAGPVRMFNGSVRNWKSGGIHVYSSTVMFDSIDASDNGSYGVSVDESVKATFTHCTAEENEGSGFVSNRAQEVTFVDCRASRNIVGFYVGDSTLRGCTAEHSKYGGFQVTSATLSNCKAQNNGRAGINAYHSAIQQCVVLLNGQHGIVADHCSILGCTVNGNNWQGILAKKSSVQECTVQDNHFNGIHATEGRVASCAVGGNTNHGIVANGHTFVTGNQVFGHSGNADAGILVVNGSNRVEDNNLTGNYYGIMATGTVNFIARNTARSTAKNYWIAAGNRVGAIVVPQTNAAIINGNSGGGSGTTDPWSNIAY